MNVVNESASSLMFFNSIYYYPIDSALPKVDGMDSLFVNNLKLFVLPSTDSSITIDYQ
jgi:hypothetical protein